MAMRVRWRLVGLLGTWIGAFPVALAGCTGHSNGTPADAGEEFAPVAEAALDGSDEGSALADSAALLDADGAAMCHPGSVAGFRSPAVVPSRRSTACNGFGGDGGLVKLYGDACIGHMATYDACKAVSVPPNDAGAAACLQCLVSQQSPDASAYGAVVVVTIPQTNYPGCLQLLDPSEAGVACAQSFTSAGTCADYACKSACPPVDQGSLDEYNACWNEATSGACAGYWLGVESCMLAESGDGGTVVGQACFGGATIEDDYLSIAKLICGAN
jgi:hypothetical protein